MLKFGQLQFPIPDPFFGKVKLASRQFSTRSEQNGIILGWGRNYVSKSPLDPKRPLFLDK